LFCLFMICLRFYLYPSTFRASFLHPTESLFVPAVVIAFGKARKLRSIFRC
jgi:tellurite resistance protein TehA-like permease